MRCATIVQDRPVPSEKPATWRASLSVRLAWSALWAACASVARRCAAWVACSALPEARRRGPVAVRLVQAACVRSWLPQIMDRESIELTDDMVSAGVDAYQRMALHDESSWYDPRVVVVAIFRAAFLAASSGLLVHFRGQLGNSLPLQGEPQSPSLVRR
jgi:hypothetical protein